MFCKNCGNKIKDSGKFCSSCGTEVEPAVEKKEELPAAGENKSTTKKNVLDQVMGFVGIVGGFIIGKYLGLVVFIFIGAFALGQWFAKWYIKRGRINKTLIKWVVWSNIFTWLLPPLGVMTGFAALEFGNSFPSESKKYKTLAIIALVASFLNALSGILLNN